MVKNSLIVASFWYSGKKSWPTRIHSVLDSYFSAFSYFSWRQNMTDEFLDIQLDYTAKCKPVPCPNSKAKLERKIVMNENSPNVGRPYAACGQCSGNGKIC